MRKELIALRGVMAEAGIDAYVIPTDDFHGSEYVGGYFKCREYVSGFTGSAGTLVVTGDWAGLWTDGRYFLQAAEELSGSGIDLMKMGQPGVPTVQQWLEEHMAAGQTLGFDGRVMTSGTGRAMEFAMEKRQVFIRYDRDLVGEIWQSRPPLSAAPVWELDVQYAGRTRKEKLEALKTDIGKAGADCHILTSLDDLSWLLNIRGDDVACCPVVLGYLMMDETGIFLFTDEQKFSPALRLALENDGVALRPYLDIVRAAAQLKAGQTVLIDPARVSYAILKSIPADVRVLEQSNPTERSKAVKTSAERGNEIVAHIRDGVALTRFMKWLKEHVGRERITEISAAERLERFRAEQPGYLGPSFDPIFGYGPHGAIVHYSAAPESDAVLEPHGFVLADTGGHYLQGSTDVTRTFVLGPLTEQMKRHYTLVLKGHLNLAAAKFPRGCTGGALDYIARKPLWDEGLDYNHGTGHGVGYLLSVHEGPQSIRYQTSRVPSAPLEAGMITSNEPGFYLEGEYGIRLENLLLCEEAETNEYGTFLRFRNLTMCPFELEAIEVSLLTDAEKTLLNVYHETVRTALMPRFPEEERAWLREATKAI